MIGYMNLSLIQNILSILAIALGVILFALGWVSQAYKNYKRKSTEGLSFPLYLVGFTTTFVWLIYGLKTSIPMLIIPNIFGVLVGLVILIQFALYREKNSEDHLFSFSLPLLAMNFTQILGVLGVILNWTMSIIGFLHQIWKNYKKPSGIEGLETKTYVLWFSAFCVNFAYGLSISNAPLIWGGVPGLVFLAIILFQISRYRKQQAEVK